MSDDNDHRREALDRLLEEARDDPELFHALVFEPEEVLGTLDYLDRSVKGKIIGVTPEELLAGLAGFRDEGGDEGGELFCTRTCGDDSCWETCGPRSCDVTCRSSCGDTCSHSCGDTTHIVHPFSREERFPRRERFDRGPFRPRRRW